MPSLNTITWPWRQLLTSPVGMVSPSVIAYLINDTFTTPLTAGNVDGTAAEPGPGTRDVVDPSNHLSISGGEAVTDDPTGDPALGYVETISRSNGNLVKIRLMHSATTVYLMVGYDYDYPTSPTTVSGGFYITAGLTLNIRSAAGTLVVGSVVTSTYYEYVTIPRNPSGFYYLIKGGAFTDWTLVWFDQRRSDATLTPFFVHNHGAGSVSADYVVVPKPLYLPSPLVYDSFTRANSSAIGSTEPTGPDGQSVPAIAWTEQSGDWEIVSNNLLTASSSGAGIITLAGVGSGDYVIEANVTTPGSGTAAAGLVVRFLDTSNYWYLKITPGTSGTDFELIEVNAGVPTTRASSDRDWAAATSYEIKVVCDGDDEWRVFVDNVATLTYTTTNTFNETATLIGFRDEGDANFTFEDILVFERHGYNQLERF